MKLFNISKNDKQTKYYNKLMNINNINEFSFEKKYAFQEKKLLKLFGKAKKFDKKIKLIIITDTHNTLNEDDFKQFVLSCKEYDICLLLGDFGYRDIPIILKYIEKNKIYALLGNHDYDYISDYELNNLNGNIININGVKLLGIQGSFKYKPVDFPAFSQKDSITILNSKPGVDILVSHDNRFNSNSKNDPGHQGLFGITYYLFKNKVPYHIHGHIHNPYKIDMINGTKEISSYKYQYIEL